MILSRFINSKQIKLSSVGLSKVSIVESTVALYLEIVVMIN